MRHNDDALRDQGFLYPLLPGNRQSHTFLRKATINSIKLNTKDDLDHYIASLSEQISCYSPASVILSSEHFWPASPTIVASMISSLEHLFSQIKVTVYLRPQRDLWMSLYSQCAKGMNVLPSHSSWGTPEYCGKEIYEHGMYYVNVLDGYRQASNKIDIDARIYDRSLFPNQDVVSDFTSSCKLDKDRLGIPSNINSNESLGWKAVEFSKALATYFRSDATRRKKIASVMRQGFVDARKHGYDEWIGKSPNYLTESEQDAIHEYYAANNKHLSAEYFNSATIFRMDSYLPVNPYSIDNIPSEEKQALADFMLTKLDNEDIRNALSHLRIFM